jgi:hypothetical protein
MVIARTSDHSFVSDHLHGLLVVSAEFHGSRLAHAGIVHLAAQIRKVFVDDFAYTWMVGRRIVIAGIAVGNPVLDKTICWFVAWNWFPRVDARTRPPAVAPSVFFMATFIIAVIP